MLDVFKDGIKVIDEVFADFQKNIERLKQGVAKCEEEIGKNTLEITELQTTNTKLDESKQKAIKLSENLTKLIS